MQEGLRKIYPGNDYTPAERVSLKSHPVLNEKWVQERIAETPEILGLGDLILKDQERVQPRAGRLDLLLQHEESSRRYEVEIQLGAVDESHIIRTIEYWDIEKKRYPQYDHCAVIVAEDITSRFLNVINLFNGHIPLIALQMSALKVGEHTTLVFTKVLDELTLGLVDDDEEVREVTNRKYWEMKSTSDTIKIADEMLGILRKEQPQIGFKYNKFYIGLEKNGRVNNFAFFRPKRKYCGLEIRLPESDQLTNKLDDAGLELMDYYTRGERYRIRLRPSTFLEQREVIEELLDSAYKYSTER